MFVPFAKGDHRGFFFYCFLHHSVFDIRYFGRAFDYCFGEVSCAGLGSIFQMDCLTPSLVKNSERPS